MTEGPGDGCAFSAGISGCASAGGGGAGRGRGFLLTGLAAGFGVVITGCAGTALGDCKLAVNTAGCEVSRIGASIYPAAQSSSAPCSRTEATTSANQRRDPGGRVVCSWEGTKSGVMPLV